MNRTNFFPILWPLLLLFLSGAYGDLQGRIEAQRQGRLELAQARGRLEALRARTVAGRLDSQLYEDLLKQFAALTGLPASDPFLAPKVTTLGTGHVASLISGLQKALDPSSRSDWGDDSESSELEFLPVSLGVQERIGPFVMVEFVLNLRGRYRSIPHLLATLTGIGQQRKLALSLGEMRIATGPETALTGEGLWITLPVRAYFRE